jgi:general secretion pathway protein G
MPRSALRRCGDVGAIALVLLVAWVVFVEISAPMRGYDAKQAKAQLGCQGLAIAIETYTEHKANTKHVLPRTLHELVNPPFGGPSFLRNGEADLLDPWGKPYEMELIKRSDGSECILVSTTTPDGTPISQFGIGRKNAVPNL